LVEEFGWDIEEVHVIVVVFSHTKTTIPIPWIPVTRFIYTCICVRIYKNKIRKQKPNLLLDTPFKKTAFFCISSGRFVVVVVVVVVVVAVVVEVKPNDYKQERKRREEKRKEKAYRYKRTEQY